MKLSLAELLPLKSTISNTLQEKLRERNRVAMIEFEKGTTEKETHEKSFNDVTNELRTIRSDYRKIDTLIAEANVKNKVEWEDGPVTINEALEFAKQLRSESYELKNFGTRKKIEKMHSYGIETPMYQELTYDPSKIHEKGIKLEKKANRLSMAIEKANHKFEIEFPEAEKYL